MCRRHYSRCCLGFALSHLHLLGPLKHKLSVVPWIAGNEEMNWGFNIRGNHYLTTVSGIFHCLIRYWLALSIGFVKVECSYMFAIQRNFLKPARYFLGFGIGEICHVATYNCM